MQSVNPRPFESEMTVNSLIKRSDFHVFDYKEKMFHKVLKELPESIPDSSRLFVSKLFWCLYKRYGSQMLRGVSHGRRAMQCQLNPVCEMPVYPYRKEQVLNIFWDCFSRNSCPSSINSKEEIGKFVNALRYTSFAKVLNKQIESIINNIIQLNLGDLLSLNLTPKCCNIPVQVRSSSNTEVVRKTGKFPCPSDSEFKEFLSVLDRDYTRSSKGYGEKKVESNVNQGDYKKSRPISCNFTFTESDTSDSDEFSVSSSDDENDDARPAYRSTICRYFNRKSEFESSKHFADFDTDDCIVFSEDAGESSKNFTDIDADDDFIVFSEDSGEPSKHFDGLGADDYDSFSEDTDDDIEILDQTDCVSSDDSWADDCEEESFRFFGDASDTNAGTSLSQRKVSAFFLNGFENPAFESECWFTDCSNIKMVNDAWKKNNEDVPESEREAKRVSFAPTPTIRSFEPDDDNYSYSSYVLDQMRFRSRILEFEDMMAPFLTAAHRILVFRRNTLSNS